MHLPRLASLIFGQPHYITLRAAASIVHAVRDKLGAPGGLTIEANGFVGDEAFQRTDRGYRWKGYRLTQSGVAILDMQGELVNRGAYLGADSGLISYEGMRQQIRNLAADPAVKAVLIDCDCPGGEANGMDETAAELRALAAKKPVFAHANSLMCSAAYGICSAATKIVTTKTGFVGSIGCVMMHADYSGQLTKQGVVVTFVHAGAHKIDGNAYQPLPKEVKAEFETICSRYYDAFVATVATNRPSISASAIRATEARIYHGPDAVAAGLADTVGTFETALADLEALIAQPSASVTPIGSTGPAAKQERPMTMTHTQAQVDAARAEGVAAGVATERARMGAILGSSEAASAPKLAAHLAFKTDTSAEAALPLLAAAEPEAKPAPAAAVDNGLGLELAAPTTGVKADAKPAPSLSAADIYAARRKQIAG
jgi:signal peptide peptidase SppA